MTEEDFKFDSVAMDGHQHENMDEQSHSIRVHNSNNLNNNNNSNNNNDYTLSMNNSENSLFNTALSISSSSASASSSLSMMLPHTSSSNAVHAVSSSKSGTLNPNEPGPRYWHGCCVAEGTPFVFLWGGIARRFEFLEHKEDIFVFDLESEKWLTVTARGTPPPHRWGLNMANVGMKMFIFGGWDSQYQFQDMHVFTYSLTESGQIEGSWQDITYRSETKPECRSCASLTRLTSTSELLLFGGAVCIGGPYEYFNDLFYFDTLTNRWESPTTRGTPPSGRFQHAAVCVGDALLVYGGADGTALLNDMHLFDTRNKTWHSIGMEGDIPPTIDLGRTQNFRVHSVFFPMVKIGSLRLLKFGHLDDRHNRPRNDVYIFDFEQKRWTRIKLESNDEQHIPKRQTSPQMAVWRNKCLLHGGGNAGNTENYTHIIDAGKIPGVSSLHVSDPMLLHRNLRSELTVDLNAMVDNDAFADIVLVTPDDDHRRIHAHRAILAHRNDWFRTMFQSGMQETTASEIHIEDVTFESMLQVVRFIYTANPSIVTADNAVELLVLGNRFHVSGLVSCCERVLIMHLDPENVIDLLLVAEQHNSAGLIDACIEFASQHPEDTAAHPRQGEIPQHIKERIRILL